MIRCATTTICAATVPSARTICRKVSFNALVYELPVGKGRKYAASMPPVANAALGGWQVSSIVRFGSGLPLGFTAPNTLGNYGFQVQRPNVDDLKTAAIDNPTPDRWFNTAAFVAPGTYDIGTLSRWTSNIRFGPTKHAILAILKNFRVLELYKAQFRAEMFNMTNTPQFGRANTTVGNTDFGKVSGTTNVGPREYSARAENTVLSCRAPTAKLPVAYFGLSAAFNATFVAFGLSHHPSTSSGWIFLRELW